MKRKVVSAKPKRQQWTQKKVREGIRLMKQGYSHLGIAKQLGVSISSWKTALHYYNESVPPQERAYFCYVPETVAPKYDKHLRLYGDFIVAGDFHIPFQSCEMCDYMVDVAKREKIKELIIGGDFLDEKDLYRLPDQSPDQKAYLNEHLGYAERFLDDLSHYFMRIYWLSGDHDERLLKRVDYRINLPRFVRSFTDLQEKGKLIVSDYFHCIVNDSWRISHPDKATRRATTKPLQLVHKYHMNVICLHGHTGGTEWDEGQKYQAIALGCMTDEEKHWYTQVRDTGYPLWRKQFAILKNNKIKICDESDLPARIGK